MKQMFVMMVSLAVSMALAEQSAVRLVNATGKVEEGKASPLGANGQMIRVGSYNIRYSGGDIGTPNEWKNRKGDLVAHIRKLNLDVLGLQEVCPDQMAFLRENLPEYEFVGDHREAGRKTGEASPVVYRESRFRLLASGTFWLSDTPEVAGSVGWGAMLPRVCSYVVLKDESMDKRFCFANTHADNISEQSRVKGMELIIKRMAGFGAECPIVFTGDHNCCHEDDPAALVRKVLKDARDHTETKGLGPRNTFHGFGKFKDGPMLRRGKMKDFCIDYIYVSDGTRVLDFITHVEKRPGTDLYPSDHFPITATIALP